MNPIDPIFPEVVVDLNGRSINIIELAKLHVLILITLKAAWCPVCPQLLLILNLYGLQDSPPESFRDPFDGSIIMKVPPEEIPKQIFPIELLAQIFEHIESREMVKTVVATCRQWRAIGFDIIAMRMKQAENRVLESLVICSQTKRSDSDKIILPADNKAISIHELDLRIKDLNGITEIVQRLVPPTDLMAFMIMK
ncbi:9737_t:CDS:2 [Racocetra fulgida]|uniref:9737_t:CDS:1 n=1 Tax=Racocetra fulgida TaxID=60492 RepID=A0A9N9B2V0_9GLOM|nr:9737_t:CDS:2 [Racocetra fulgida]